MIVPQFMGAGNIRWIEKAVPEPGAGELLLQVRANALCGTDRYQYKNGSPDVTPGHEVTGVVAEAGTGTNTPVGTLGVVYIMVFCGVCRACRLGHTNQCHDKRGDIGFSRDGGLGPYALVEERTFFPVAADLEPAEATLLLDVMGTSRHAITRARRVRDDVETILVVRAGPVGLGILAMAKMLFGDGVKVFVADQSPFRLNLVDKLGGIAVRLSKGDLDDSLRSYGLDHVDVAFDASGREDARNLCMRALGTRGVLVCVAHGRDRDIHLRVSADLIAPERAVVGSEYFRYDELALNLPLLGAERAYFAQIITHRFPLADLTVAFETFLSGETGKVLVEHR